MHCGHENLHARGVADFCERLTGVDVVNTPLNHFLHHAISGGSTPKYCGFYVTVWDKVFGSEDKEGLQRFMKALDTRTEAEFEAIEIPKYEQLASVSHWSQALTARGGKEATKAA